VKHGARVFNNDSVLKWLRSGGNVVATNSLSSVKLVEQLLADRFTCTTGIIIASISHIPPEMKANGNEVKYSSVFAFHNHLTLVSYVPKPGKTNDCDIKYATCIMIKQFRVMQCSQLQLCITKFAKPMTVISSMQHAS
jgi:hypothetical protein